MKGSVSTPEEDSDGDPISGILKLGFQLPQTDEVDQDFIRQILSRDSTGWGVDVVMDELARGCEGSRYRPIEIVGRGGMSVVVRAHDEVLARDVALKVMPPKLSERQDLLDRFLAEAKLVASLSHPGVVPVHDLVRPEGAPPFFAMKLVEGKTLSEALREDRATDGRRRWSGVFLRICETLAYAHARGVVHRDLKPSNVMIGRFGEVSVMDWGIALIRPDFEDTPVPGGVLGTAAYMSPEQASGTEGGFVGPQSDVFSLGAMLCEILTGLPPYEAVDERSVLEAARRGDVGSALRRLATAEVSKPLIDVVRACLSRKPVDRPADAGVVSDLIEAVLDDELVRAEALRIEAAEARARAVEEQRARGLTLVLAGVVLVALVAAAAVGYHLMEGGRERQRATDEAVLQRIHRAETNRDQALESSAFDIDQLRAAAANATEAVSLAGSPDASQHIRDRAIELDESLVRALEVEEEGARFIGALEGLRDFAAHLEHSGDLVEDYARCFSSAGYDFAELDPSSLASSEEAPGSPMARLGMVRQRDAVVQAIDEWAHAVWITQSRGQSIGASPGIQKLREVGNALDPDPWRKRVRQALDSDDSAELIRLSREEVEGRSLASLRLLARSLAVAGEVDATTDVYRAASKRFPEDYHVHHELATVLDASGAATPEVREECIRLLSMCLALRPHASHIRGDLGIIVAKRSGPVEGVIALCEALRHDTEIPLAWHGLSALLMNHGYYDRALDVLPHALRHNPDDLHIRMSLGVCSIYSARYEEADALLLPIREQFDVPAVQGQMVLNYREWGRFEQALEILEASKDPGVRAFLEDTRALMGLDRTMRDGGVPQITAPIDRLRVAAVHYRRQNYAAAARAFHVVLDQADEREDGLPRHSLMHLRYSAVAAGLAGFGLGEDGPSLTDEERSLMREWSRAWFMRDVRQREERAASGVSVQKAARGLAHIQDHYPPVIALREAIASSDLDVDEEAAWAEVESAHVRFFAEHDGPLDRAALDAIDALLRERSIEE